MIIADTLRQEAMPEMVFAICKMALLNPQKGDLEKVMTLQSGEKSSTQFARVYQFSIKSGFIKEAGDGTVSTVFSEEDLSSFRRFRYAVLRGVFAEQDTSFTALAKWYLSQNIPDNVDRGQSVFSLGTAADFVRDLPNSISVDEYFIQGFRFWMVALGLTSFNPLGPGAVSRPLLFATHRAIGDWLEFSNPFQKEVRIHAREFFEKLTRDLPVFDGCIKNNTVVSSLSSGLRVLQSCGQIEIVRVADAGDVWHLSRSAYYSTSNDLTDLVIKENRHANI